MTPWCGWPTPHPRYLEVAQQIFISDSQDLLPLFFRWSRSLPLAPFGLIDPWPWQRVTSPSVVKIHHPSDGARLLLESLSPIDPRPRWGYLARPWILASEGKQGFKQCSLMQLKEKSTDTHFYAPGYMIRRLYLIILSKSLQLRGAWLVLYNGPHHH